MKGSKLLFVAAFLVLLGLTATPGSAQWLPQPPTGSGPIYYNGGNVGIGTSTPNYLLHLLWNTNSTNAQFTMQNLSSGSSAGTDLWCINDTGYLAGIGIMSSTKSTYGALVANSASLYTSSPAGFTLMSDHATGGIKFAAGGSTERMRIDASGNVGVGTTTPQTTFHIATESTSSPRGLLVQQAADSTGSAFMVLRKSRGSLAVPAVVQSLDSLGTIYAEGYDGSSYVRGGANIKFIANGTIATGSMPTDLAFSTGSSGLGTEVMRLTNGGAVGIGTSTPAAGIKLHVVGNAQFDGTVSGTFIKAQYQDVAEWVPSKSSLDPGTVVVLDPDAVNGVMASGRAYDTSVAGVVSGQPGIVLGQEGASKEKVATTGRVRVKVDASRGPIAVGDLLVTSDKGGYAMRSTPIDVGGVLIHRPGTIIGKALEPLQRGDGEILVLLSLQ